MCRVLWSYYLVDTLCMAVLDPQAMFMMHHITVLVWAISTAAVGWGEMALAPLVFWADITQPLHQARVGV